MEATAISNTGLRLGLALSQISEVAKNDHLMLSMLGINSCRWHFEIFSLFLPQKIGFDILYKLSLGDNLHKMSKPIFCKK